jgi:hypothetical protein
MPCFFVSTGFEKFKISTKYFLNGFLFVSHYDRLSTTLAWACKAVGGLWPLSNG